MSHPAGTLPAIAERDRNRPVRMPGAIRIGTSSVRPLFKLISIISPAASLVLDAQLLRRGGRNQRRVIPSQLRDRVGRFLQPAVVIVAAVVGMEIRREDDLVTPAPSTAVRFGCLRDIGFAPPPA